MLRSMKFSALPTFLESMYQEINEEELWKIYLSSPFRESSFEEWKKKVLGDGRTKEEIETEAKDAAVKALELLGGDFDGG